jgi:hypothetical protein
VFAAIFIAASFCIDKQKTTSVCGFSPLPKGRYMPPKVCASTNKSNNSSLWLLSPCPRGTTCHQKYASIYHIIYEIIESGLDNR